MKKAMWVGVAACALASGLPTGGCAAEEQGQGVLLTTTPAFAAMPHAARVNAESEYDGKKLEQRYDLFLWKAWPDTALEKVDGERDGGLRIQSRHKQGHVVEIWMGRDLWAPDGVQDVAMILEVAKEEGREALQRVSWIRYDYEPPTPHWYKDCADRPMPLLCKQGGPQVAEFRVTLNDKSLFQMNGQLTLHVILQR
ncbi:MAG: hypothetical protein NTV86_19950 [Planctomycetota bacterium]|nr:hypothetical protein [Planctomycetota bacterium]